MQKIPVISISRQYGSGGRLIAQKLAKELKIPYYDKELITIAAEESGFDKKIFEEADKSASSSLLFSLSVYGGPANALGVPLSERVFQIQSDVIKEIAKKGPCVIVGRCADYTLRDEKVLSVFLKAPMEFRRETAVSEYCDNPNEVEEKIKNVDKKRSVYYQHFTGDKWGLSDHYNMIIDTSTFGIDKTVEVLKSAALNFNE